jgi:isopentenyl-diphosphate delta-isomerase
MSSRPTSAIPAPLPFQQKAEYLEIYDQDNQPLHILKPRPLVHRDGDWHRSIQVFVVNAEEQLLCNLRSPYKDVYPAFWDISIGGHVAPEEPVLFTALRELEEELGIKVLPQELRFVTHCSTESTDASTGHTDREHVSVFLYQTYLIPGDFHMAEEEIDALEFLPISYIRQSLLQEVPPFRFIPMTDYFVGLLERVEAALLCG